VLNSSRGEKKRGTYWWGQRVPLVQWIGMGSLLSLGTHSTLLFGTMKWGETRILMKDILYFIGGSSSAFPPGIEVTGSYPKLELRRFRINSVVLRISAGISL
jgi:hypothetical protein